MGQLAARQCRRAHSFWGFACARDCRAEAVMDGFECAACSQKRYHVFVPAPKSTTRSVRQGMGQLAARSASSLFCVGLRVRSLPRRERNRFECTGTKNEARQPSYFLPKSTTRSIRQGLVEMCSQLALSCVGQWGHGVRAAAGAADDGPNGSLREGGRAAGYGASLGAPRGRGAPVGAGQGPVGARVGIQLSDTRTVP